MTTASPSISASAPRTEGQDALGRALQRERNQSKHLRARDVTLAIATPLLLLIAWQAAGATGAIDTRIFPLPTTIIKVGAEMTQSGELPKALGITVARLMTGYVLGAILGIAAGLIMGVWRPVRAAVDPLFSALYALPKIAILPILLLIFGFTETPRVLLVLIGVFFILQINTLSGIRQIDPRILEAATAYGATGWRRFRYVILPAVLPSIFTGLRVSAGMAVTIIVSVEFVAADNGIGYLIWNSWQIFQPSPMYVGMAAVAVLGAILTGVVLYSERLLVPWRSTSPRRRLRKAMNKAA